MSPTIFRTGYISSTAACIATLGYGIVQIGQVAGWLIFPLDEILIYSFSLCISIPFLVSLAMMHYTVPQEAKPWTLTALAFGTCYVVYAITVYTIQLGIVLPGLHSTSSSPLLTITPHSLFWTLDGLAYFCMGIAALFLAQAFRGRPGMRSLRIFLLAHGLLTPVIAFVYFFPTFSTRLLFLGSPWLITACGSLFLMARYFKREAVSA